MLSFHAVPLFLMGMLLAAVVIIFIKTDRTPTQKPLTRKQLRALARKEIDRYVAKSANSQRSE